MPIRVYECPCGTTTEKYYPTQKNNSQTITCPNCKKRAHQIITGTHFTVEFGSAYGFSTRSDRRDWMKKLDIQGWHTDEHTRESNGAIKPARNRLV